MYLLKLALRPWKQAFLSQFFLSVVIGFFLIVLGFLFCMQQGLRLVMTRLQNEQIWIAYLDSMDEASAKQILKRVKKTVSDEKNVEVRLTSRAQFVSRLSDEDSHFKQELEQLGEDLNQIIPQYMIISGVLSEFAFKQIKNMKGVESMERARGQSSQMLDSLNLLKWIARAGILGIVLGLLAGMIQCVKWHASFYQDSLQLLRLWGEAPGWLMVPGLISGTGVGWLGGGIAGLVWMSLGRYGARKFFSFYHFFSPVSKVVEQWNPSQFLMIGLFGFMFIFFVVFLAVLFTERDLSY